MSDYIFDTEESSLLYTFIRDIALDTKSFSKETIEEIEDCFVCLEKWFAMFIKRNQTNKNGEYKPMFRYRWSSRNKSLTTEDYLWNDVEHLMNETILEDWIFNGIISYDEEEVEHNHGPMPDSSYGPWHDVITHSTVWNFYDWDASKLHDILKNFRKMSRGEKYNFVSNFAE